MSEYNLDDLAARAMNDALDATFTALDRKAVNILASNWVQREVLPLCLSDDLQSHLACPGEIEFDDGPYILCSCSCGHLGRSK